VKQKILAKREAFFATKEVAACVLPTLEDEAELDEWLAVREAAESAAGVVAVCLECN
jgi:hypothetical protein